MRKTLNEILKRLKKVEKTLASERKKSLLFPKILVRL